MRFPTIPLVLLALALPATAGAATPRFLPPVKERLSDATSVERTCAADMLRARKRGIDRQGYRAPMSGFVNVRLRARRGDWDLAVFDRETKRPLASSQAFGSRELAQTWVESGQRLAIQGCRRSGRSRRARLSIQLVDVKPPANRGTPQLLRVDVKNGADVQRLEGLGLDVTHQIHGGHADVIATGAKQRNLLGKDGIHVRHGHRGHEPALRGEPRGRSLLHAARPRQVEPAERPDDLPQPARVPGGDEDPGRHVPEPRAPGHAAGADNAGPPDPGHRDRVERERPGGRASHLARRGAAPRA